MSPYPTQLSVKTNFFQEEETMCCSQEEIDTGPFKEQCRKGIPKTMDIEWLKEFT